jgi:glycoprotein 3-alpha-L-fucosyltransferase
MAAVDALMNAGVPMDRFGVCYGQRSSEDKVSLISRYKFYLAFENSIEPDYVTEKFFQPLAVGTVPISIGAPNIGDFAPSNKSYIHIARLEDASTVAERIKRLLADQSAYDEMLEWKQRPDDQFLALVDMAVVHSACRLCLHLASEVRLKEIQGQASDRLCQCSADLAVHRLLVRERGRVEFESIAFNVNTGTLSDLQQIIKRHFESLNNGQFRPIWSGHRRDVLGTEKDLRLFRIYAVGLSQREALFTSFISTTSQLKELIRQRPCPRIEVIFI